MKPEKSSILKKTRNIHRLNKLLKKGMILIKDKKGSKQKESKNKVVSDRNKTK